MEHFLGNFRRPLILASGSPRRSELLKEMGLTFKVWPKPVAEDYPQNLNPTEIAEYLAKLKAAEFTHEEIKDAILITADTLVAKGNKILNKPANRTEAIEMVLSLSGKEHEVITGVVLKSQEHQIVFHEVTRVTFFSLSQKEIEYYVDKFEPYDKAGAYGIQEWIGHIGVEKIDGNYNNVVGLPTARLYQQLKEHFKLI